MKPYLMKPYLYAYTGDILNIVRSVAHEDDHNLYLKSGSQVKFVKPSDAKTLEPYSKIPCQVFLNGDFLEVEVVFDVSAENNQVGEIWHVPSSFVRTNTGKSNKDVMLGILEAGDRLPTVVDVKDSRTGKVVESGTFVTIVSPSVPTFVHPEYPDLTFVFEPESECLVEATVDEPYNVGWIFSADELDLDYLSGIERL